MRGILDFYPEDPDDIDEPVERYEKVFDPKMLPLIRERFTKDSDVRNLVYAFDVLRELIDENKGSGFDVLVRSADRNEYAENYKRAESMLGGMWKTVKDVDYSSLILIENFVKKREYELIYRFLGLVGGNLSTVSLDGKPFVLMKNDDYRKSLGFGFIILHDFELGKGICLGITPKVDPWHFGTIHPLDDEI